MRRRCSRCGRFLGRYVIVVPEGEGYRLVDPRCGSTVNGGRLARDGQAFLDYFAANKHKLVRIRLNPSAVASY